MPTKHKKHKKQKKQKKTTRPSNQVKKKKRSKTQKLFTEQMNKEKDKIMDFLFEKIKEKNTNYINFNSLLRTIVSNDLIDKINEDDIEEMIEMFSENDGFLTKEIFKKIFFETNVNIKPFINDH